ncbi:hypothetical protein BDZ89DRAFT_792852 [Hymenopellis radicata]|nr:hypothetical protein BDZ89DRAFT_792852 [Hymenopellis radicata]
MSHLRCRGILSGCVAASHCSVAPYKYSQFGGFSLCRLATLDTPRSLEVVRGGQRQPTGCHVRSATIGFLLRLSNREHGYGEEIAAIFVGIEACGGSGRLSTILYTYFNNLELFYNIHSSSLAYSSPAGP